MRDRLFSAGDASDRAYVNLRDRQEEQIITAREFVESLWDRFRGLADPNFLTEVRRDFHARFWEMYLTCALMNTLPSEVRCYLVPSQVRIFF